jgi:hypothetical protein
MSFAKEIETFRRHADCDDRAIKELQSILKKLANGVQQSKDKNKAQLEQVKEQRQIRK